jgi:hypothetical protein
MLDRDALTCAANAILDRGGLERENRTFRGTAGVSTASRGYGFIPAFLDRETGQVHLSRTTDGQPARVHTLDGLPDAVVTERDANGRVLRVKPSLQSGFARSGVFFTREQAVVQASGQKHGQN